MELDDICSTGLGLGLGCLVKQENCSESDQQKKKKLSLKHDHFFPSLTLGPSDDIYQSATKIDASKVHGEWIDLHQQASSLSAVSSFSNSSVKERDFGGEEVELERVSSRVSDEDEDDIYQSATKIDASKVHGEWIDLHQQASSLSAVSSFSNSSVKERDFGGEEVELERVSSRVSDEDEEGSPRKKLRLSKEQSGILEENFKEHSTLNPKQKQALAEQLNLRPRQVEVWFQNRRARTKLKQTEVDCELLKKCCETLTEENKKLQKELQELKSLKLTASYNMQLPAATLTMCPSCERVANGGEGPSTSPFTMGQKSYFFNPFTHPSAAC